MAVVTITIKFKPTPATLQYTARVDDTDLVIKNGTARLALESGKECVLYWDMWGNPKDSMGIVANNGTKDILTIKDGESAIPDNKQRSADYRRMTP